jgi:stress response protein YsnF/sporulation protein YlmC with PRC-barrel domain
MTNMTTEQLTRWIGSDAIDSDGDKVGRVEALYLDDDTGEPEWFAVKTGWFGTRVSFIPVTGSTSEGDRLRVAYDKSTIKDAPHAEADGHLSAEEESALYQHYGVGNGMRSDGDIGRTDRTDDVGQSGRDVSGPMTDDAMTRSEEEIRVGTTQRETGSARLRKWVETEYVQQTVPVRKERASVVTEPITDANVDRAMSGPEISSEEHEVVLHEEEPVVEKRVVPKERVRLETDTFVEDETVDAEVQKERIEVEGDAQARRR